MHVNFSTWVSLIENLPTQEYLQDEIKLYRIKPTNSNNLADEVDSFTREVTAAQVLQG